MARCSHGIASAIVAAMLGLFSLLSLPTVSVAEAPATAAATTRAIGSGRRTWIVFKGGGKVVAVGDWQVKPPLVIFHGDNRTLLSVRLDSIDFDATRRLNGVPPPLPGAALELQMKEFQLTPEEEMAIRHEAQENAAIEMSLTPEERAERQQRREAMSRGLGKLFDDLRCIARAQSALERELCRLRVAIAYR